MEEKNRVSKSLLLPNPTISHEAPPHSNQASPVQDHSQWSISEPSLCPFHKQPRSAPLSGYKSETLGLGNKMCTQKHNPLGDWKQEQERQDSPPAG